MGDTSFGRRTLRSSSHLVLALWTGVALAACGGGTGPEYDNGGDDQGAEGCTGDIEMVNNTFSPQSHTVSAGTTVTWCNDNGVNHTVTADDDSFDSGVVAPNQTFERTFNEAGTYTYHCTFHGQPDSGMHGTLVVE